MSELLLSRSEKNALATKGYHFKKLLGEGADSKVFLINYTKSNKDQLLACKVYDIKKVIKKVFVSKFLPRELDTLINIEHPHIIRIHSIFQRATKFYIFMRFAERGDLFEYVKQYGPIEESQARIWFRQLCLAIQYLHRLNIAHRDIKCENALITNSYNIKLADFGFTRITVNDAGEQVLSDTYCGSITYASPEIIRGKPYYPKPTDIWSLGVLLYIMLNKAMPFDESNLKKLYILQMTKKWKFKSKRVNSLSDSVKKLIKSLLEPNANRRLNINDAVSSDWILEDSNLHGLTPAEEAALLRAEIDSGKFKMQLTLPTQTSKKHNECIMIKESSDIHFQVSDVNAEQTVHMRTSEEKRTKKPCGCCIS